MMKKRVKYPVEIKCKAVKMKENGYTNREILEEWGMKNRSQIKTWRRWYRVGQTYCFKQPVGKQYAYGGSARNICRKYSTNSASGGENSSAGKVHGSRKELEPKAVVKTIEALRPHFGVRELYVPC
jgi:hypothetical protein